jgi:hypothetical protein
VIHSQKEQRYRCKRCSRTFSATRGTALYRMHKPKELVLTVVTLLAYGCPVQAIFAAFSLDRRTVARWQRESAVQCKRVHEHLIEAGKVWLLQVQADGIRVKAVGGIFWLAAALEVKSRLWLGGCRKRVPRPGVDPFRAYAGVRVWLVAQIPSPLFSSNNTKRYNTVSAKGE